MDRGEHLAYKLEDIEQRISDSEKELSCTTDFLEKLDLSAGDAIRYVSAIRSVQKEVLRSLIVRRENMLGNGGGK